uniref:Ig-like domain-containing protein n=1 Tax=Steinernema glaseri TaxID=37863 RepID=A0A1I7Y7D2_9BILA
MIKCLLIVLSAVLQAAFGDALKPQFVVPLPFGKDDSRTPHTVAARQGDSFQINCNLEGKWPKGTKVEWAKDGNVLKETPNMKIVSHQTLRFENFDEDRHGGVFECLARVKNMRSTQRIIVRKNASSDFKLPPHVQFCRKKSYCLNEGICLEDTSGQEFCICTNKYRGERCHVPPLSRIEGLGDNRREEEPKSEVVLGWRDLLILVLILIIFCFIICMIVTFAPFLHRFLNLTNIGCVKPLYHNQYFCSNCGTPAECLSKQCGGKIDEHDPQCSFERKGGVVFRGANDDQNACNQDKEYLSIPMESCDEGDAEERPHDRVNEEKTNQCPSTNHEKIPENNTDCTENNLSNNGEEGLHGRKTSRSRLVMQKSVDHDEDIIGTGVKNNRLSPGLLHLASTDCNYFHSTKQSV